MWTAAQNTDLTLELTSRTNIQSFWFLSFQVGLSKVWQANKTGGEKEIKWSLHLHVTGKLIHRYYFKQKYGEHLTSSANYYFCKSIQYIYNFLIIILPILVH